MKTIRIEFKPRKYGDSPYRGRHLEVRFYDKQKRFYEVVTGTKEEYCLTRETVKWLIHVGSLPRTKELLTLTK